MENLVNRGLGDYPRGLNIAVGTTSKLRLNQRFRRLLSTVSARAVGQSGVGGDATDT